MEGPPPQGGPGGSCGGDHQPPCDGPPPQGSCGGDGQMACDGPPQGPPTNTTAGH